MDAASGVVVGGTGMTGKSLLDALDASLPGVVISGRAEPGSTVDGNEMSGDPGNGSLVEGASLRTGADGRLLLNHV